MGVTQKCSAMFCFLLLSAFLSGFASRRVYFNLGRQICVKLKGNTVGHKRQRAPAAAPAQHVRLSARSGSCNKMITHTQRGPYAQQQQRNNNKRNKAEGVWI